MTKWFKTKNNQILDLSIMNYFWIESTNKITVFCKDDIDTWNIGQFKTQEEAIAYIDEIYKFLSE